MLETGWRASYEGHALVVTRTELTKGFSLTWDGVEIARQSWSFFGLGELHGSADVQGRKVDVKASLRWGGLREIQGKCSLTVDGKPLEVQRFR